MARYFLKCIANAHFLVLFFYNRIKISSSSLASTQIRNYNPNTKDTLLSIDMESYIVKSSSPIWQTAGKKSTEFFSKKEINFIRKITNKISAMNLLK